MGGTSLTYDGRGNLTSGTPRTYGFDSQNRLISASGSPAASLSYDPADRLTQTSGSVTTQFLYDGANIVGEYVGGVLAERYVDGPDVDEPLVWYHGSTTADGCWTTSAAR